MPGHLLNRVTVILLMLLAAANVTAAPVIVESRANHAAKLDAANERLSVIRSLGDRNDVTALSMMLEQIDGDAKMDVAVRDHLLEVTLLAMSRTVPDDDARTAVNRYRGRPVKVFVRLPGEGSEFVVPLYDPAATAELTIRVWDTVEATEQVSLALRSALWQTGDFLQPMPGMSQEAWQAGARRAFDSVDRRIIAATKSELLHSMTLSVEYGPLLLTAATRLGDADLYKAIVTQGDARTAREAIGSAFQFLKPAEAIALLIDATAKPELASSAILELGTIASEKREIRSWLLDRLGDPLDGASAALALARSADDDVLSEIRTIILGDASELLKLRAALVLRVSELAAAQSLRQDLLSRSLSSPKLRQALR